MILIGLGANMPGPFGEPSQTLAASLQELAARGVATERASGLWASAPVPASDQPWYKNAVIAVQTALSPQELLKLLKSIEKDFGRQSAERNAPRVLDLDLLAYEQLVLEDQNVSLNVPHSRMHERRFVLMPLAQIAPDWRHPVLNRTASEMLLACPPDEILPIEGDWTPHA